MSSPGEGGVGGVGAFPSQSQPSLDSSQSQITTALYGRGWSYTNRYLLTLIIDLVERAARHDLVAATHVERRKETHYRDCAAGTKFVPFALETYDALSHRSDRFLVEQVAFG